MLQKLSLDEFLAFAKIAKRVAVFREISADRLTPISIVERLGEEMRDGTILESGRQQEDTGRYSFITFNSMAELRAQNKVITQRIGKEISTHQTHPFTLLRKMISDLSCVGKDQIMNFINGPVGFISYDAVRFFEDIPDRHAVENNDALPDMFFNFYTTTLVYDHHQQKLLISMIVEIDNNPEKAYKETEEKIDQLILKITSSSNLHLPQTNNSHINHQHNKQKPEVTTDLEDKEFITIVERAKKHIIDGDAFQIVLSRRFKQAYTASPFDIYRSLRSHSPAPYMFYLPIDNAVMIGASPERLISVHNRQVTINPIAGTRRRSSETEDQKIAADLLSDEKECAEHMMLVDLGRNDLGAVCKPGTVKVSELLKVRHFSHVSHITSNITGQLRDDKDALDALTAAFPAGTLSGAPKIRAMEIIDELETSKRGIYGGIICRLDYQGNFDSCIAIRMAVLKDGIATVRTGAGIVYDSNPQAEADETRHKARGILEALSLAEEKIS